MQLKYEIVLWGRKEGQSQLDEQVITSTTDSEHLRKAREWAKANGYSILREVKIDGSLPDFTGKKPK